MILETSKSIRTLFAVTLGSSILITYWIMDLRVGILNPREIPVFYSLFLFQDYTASLFFVGVVAAGLAAPVRRAGLLVADTVGKHPLSTATVVTAGLAVAAKFAYFGYPLCEDEYAAYFQSRIFASGKLAGSLPPDLINWLVPTQFQNFFFAVSHESGAIASQYWPGFALLLTPFTILGVPWLCNPVLGGLTVLAFHRLAQDLFEDVRAAGLVVLVTIASTAVTINAISFYSMSAHLLCNAVFAILLLRKRPLATLLAGVIGSLALVLHNPVPHILFAIPWIVWLSFQRSSPTLIACLIAGYAPLSLIAGLGWTHFLQRMNVATDAGGSTPQGGSIGLVEWAFTSFKSALSGFAWPSSALWFARTIGLVKIWLWAVPGIVALTFFGAWVRRADWRFMLFGISALLTFGGYMFFPQDQGHGWGFRYFHSAWIALPILAVAGIYRGQSRRECDSDLASYISGCAIVSLIVMLGLRLFQTHDFIGRHLAQLPDPSRSAHTIQFVAPRHGYYVLDLVENDPFLRDTNLILVAQDAKTEDAMMSDKFPNFKLVNRDVHGSVWKDR